MQKDIFAVEQAINELSQAEVAQIGGGFADEWWASNRDMCIGKDISRWDLYGAA